MKEAEPAITSTSVWSEVKRPLTSDPRYDAVGSSSLREELFNTYIRKMASSSARQDETPSRRLSESSASGRRKEAASLRASEGKVRDEQEKVKSEMEKGRKGAGREEASASLAACSLIRSATR